MLLVSGGPRVTAQVTTALLGEDVTYLEVRTPQRALKVMEDDDTFDIVVADCDTHPTGGFFLSRDMSLRAAMGAPMPPVVLLISRAQDAYLARWAEADAWIVKPVDPFDLAEVVESLVERRTIPALPGVTTLREGGEAEGKTPPPPLSTGADFRVWSDSDGAPDEAESSEAADSPQRLPSGQAER